MASNRLLLLPVLLAALVGSGCTSFELARVRNDVARQLPAAKIGEGYAVSFGAVSLGLARWITDLSVDDDEDGELARIALREVRRVQFGRYEVEGAVDARSLTMPSRLRHYVQGGDWVHLATFREADQAGWVLYRERGDRITDLFAVVLSDEELVLAKLSGDFNALVTNVLAHERTALPFFRDPETEEEAEEAEAVVEAAELVGQ